MNQPPIDRATVQRLADLARVELTEDEAERFVGQIQATVDALAIVQSVDTTDIPLTASVLPLTNVTREDEVRPSLPVDVVLAQAPDRDGDYFRVQASLTERPEGG